VTNAYLCGHIANRVSPVKYDNGCDKATTARAEQCAWECDEWKSG